LLQVADKEVHRFLDQYNELVGKYNDLVGRYNSLLGSTQAVEAYAEQLRRNNNQLLTVAARWRWVHHPPRGMPCHKK